MQNGNGLTASASASAKTMGNSYAVPAPKNNWRLAAYCAFVTVYLSLVAFFFVLIENPNEEQIKTEILQVRSDFLRNNSCVSDAELERFIAAVLQANSRGVPLTNNASASPTWTFGHAFFFTTTVVTTIGYGRNTPQTELGKLFCMLVAISGIPIMFLMFTALGERLEYMANLSLIWLYSRFAIKFKWTVLHVRVLHLSLISILAVVLILIIPAWIFTALEFPEWSYLDSLYFTFISMTTVGLGDFIPAYQEDLQHRSLYKTAVAFYLIFGLTVMMFLLPLFYAIPELHLGIRLRIVNDKAANASNDNFRAALESTNSPLGGEERLRLRPTHAATSTRYVEDSHVAVTPVAQHPHPHPQNLLLPSATSNGGTGSSTTIGSSPTGSDTGIITHEH